MSGPGAPDDLACNELVELVTEFLDDALSDGDRRRFERHLGECVDCVAYLNQIRWTVALSADPAIAAVPPPALAELRRRFRDWRAAADADRGGPL